MEVSFAKCEQVLSTLPIGYYTGRRISVSLDAEQPASYYTPMEDKICISYKQLKRAFDKVTDTSKEENVIRNMIYHEVSHAILTSAHLGEYCTSEERANVTNIFEDERIESVLRNYYHGVNFKQQIYDINGGVCNPTTALAAFFNAVRFGVAPKKYIDEINSILKQYASLHRMSDHYDVYHYAYAIYNLYCKIKQAFNEDPTQFDVPQNMKIGMGNPTEGNSMPNQNSEDKGETTQIVSISDDGEEAEEIPTDMPMTVGDPDHNIMQDIKVIRNIIKDGLDIKSRLNQGRKEDLENFRKTIERIISNFNKKNAGGSGINAYSGVFNPRALARQDYRYFERSLSIHGNNKFGTCHLNLFIDCSGSFDGNEAIVNGMMSILSEIERKNRNFTMDVVFCGNGIHKCETIQERQIKCEGGNNLPDNMKEVFMSLQKQNTCNYNIVLFDGDAFSDCWTSDRQQRCTKIFSTFDYKQTTLITDPDNKEYMGEGFNTAQVIVTNEYAKELINHVTQALTFAFG